MKKSIGMDLNPPQTSCQDSKCGWHGTISLRGKVFRGIVRSVKSHKTAIIEWPYHQYIRKYERYERRTSSIAVHNPDCIRAKEGDRVIAIECRPISKTKSAVIVAIEKEEFKEPKKKKERKVKKK